MIIIHYILLLGSLLHYKLLQCTKFIWQTVESAKEEILVLALVNFITVRGSRTLPIPSTRHCDVVGRQRPSFHHHVHKVFKALSERPRLQRPLPTALGVQRLSEVWLCERDRDETAAWLENCWHLECRNVVIIFVRYHLKPGLYRIWCGMNRLGDSDSRVYTLGDTSAFVNPAGQLLLTRRGKIRMNGVGIVFEFYIAPL